MMMGAPVLLVAAVLGALAVLPASAQLMVGDEARLLSTDIMISEDGIVEIIQRLGASSGPATLSLVSGTVENLEVKDAGGEDVQYGSSMLDETVSLSFFENTAGVEVRYNLLDVLNLEDGIWTWDYRYADDNPSTFHIPDAVDVAYINKNPVGLYEISKIGCHGCAALLQYAIDEQVAIHIVERNGEEFEIIARSHAEVGDFRYLENAGGIGFEVGEGGRFVTLVIPPDLMQGPYSVQLDSEKIRKHEFSIEEGVSALNIEPTRAGAIIVTPQKPDSGEESDNAVIQGTPVYSEEITEISPLYYLTPLLLVIGIGGAAGGVLVYRRMSSRR